MNISTISDPHVLLAALELESDDLAQKQAKTERALADATESKLLEERMHELEDQADARLVGGILGGAGQIANGAGHIAQAISDSSAKSSSSSDSSGSEGGEKSKDDAKDTREGGPRLFEASGTMLQGIGSIGQALEQHAADAHGVRAERREASAKTEHRESEEAVEELGTIRKDRERMLDLLQRIEENASHAGDAVILKG